MSLGRSLPEELKETYKQMLLDLPEPRDKDCFHQISGGEAMEFVPVDHEFYLPIINMRRELVRQPSRLGGDRTPTDGLKGTRGCFGTRLLR